MQTMKPRVSVLHVFTSRLAGLTALLLLAASLFAAPARADEASLFSLLKQPGHVLIMRHTLAPGIGDPEGFVLEDCRTQRNLSDTGQVQARELGERLRAGGSRRRGSTPAAGVDAWIPPLDWGWAR